MNSKTSRSRRRSHGPRQRARRLAHRRRKLSIETLEVRRLLASDWQNPLTGLDVNDDSTISPSDALIIINELNRNGARPLRDSLDLQAPTISYVDANGDRTLSPLDALTVINALNQGVTGAGLSLRLVADRGSSSSDRITNDPRVTGSVAMQGESISHARRINRGEVFPITTLPDGSLALDPRSIELIPDGGTRIAVAIDKSNGSTSLSQLQFTYDATPPLFVAPRLVSEDDTGISNGDGVTKITSPRVELFAEPDSQLTIEFHGSVLYDAPSTGIWSTQLSTLNDGTYELMVRATWPGTSANHPLRFS